MVVMMAMADRQSSSPAGGLVEAVPSRRDRPSAVTVVAAVALAVAVALAGCGGKGGGEGEVRLGDGVRVSLDLPPEQQPEPDDIRGAVSGIVVDDAIFPLPGATVTVRDRDWQATVGDDGRFVFEGVPPGLYTLVAHAPDHADGLSTVNVRSGQLTKAILQAHRLPFVEPYHQTLVFEDYYSLDDWVTVNGGGDPHERVVALDRAPATVVLESYWPDVQSLPVREPLWYRFGGERDRDNTTSGGGPNPLLLRFDRDAFAPDEYAVRFVVTPDVAVEAGGRVYVTIFYVDPAPAGWSFIGGDA